MEAEQVSPVDLEPAKPSPRPLLFTFRNNYGEVRACVTAGAVRLRVGFSCCNPKDLEICKAERVTLGRTIARGRYDTCPTFLSHGIPELEVKLAEVEKQFKGVIASRDLLRANREELESKLEDMENDLALGNNSNLVFKITQLQKEVEECNKRLELRKATLVTLREKSSKLRDGIKKELIKFMRGYQVHNLGMRPYTKEKYPVKEGDFQKWFGKFIEELIRIDEEKWLGKFIEELIRIDEENEIAEAA